MPDKEVNNAKPTTAIPLQRPPSRKLPLHSQAWSTCRSCRHWWGSAGRSLKALKQGPEDGLSGDPTAAQNAPQFSGCSLSEMAVGRWASCRPLNPPHPPSWSCRASRPWMPPASLFQVVFQVLCGGLWRFAQRSMARPRDCQQRQPCKSCETCPSHESDIVSQENISKEQPGRSTPQSSNSLCRRNQDPLSR